ncbi:sugar ABC transporter permease, partial [Streptococcus pyogenes]
LGSTPVVDHSLFLLIKGSMQLIIFIVMAIIHIVSMQDAKNTAIMINEGQKVPMTVKETFETIYEKGFPYLLIIPAYLAMAF